jgi:hypothetical protein
MTILSAETLTNALDLIEASATVVETTAALGCAPKSKIIFAWLKASEAAGEFDPPPSPESPWCITWRDKLEFFHLHYREAVANGRANRAVGSPPIRAELEERLAAKRAGRAAAVEPSMVEQQLPPRLIVEHVTAPAVLLDPPAPPPRPSYAYKPPPIDGTHPEQGPPQEGRFVVATHRYSKAERQAGKPQVTERGLRPVQHKPD